MNRWNLKEPSSRIFVHAASSAYLLEPYLIPHNELSTFLDDLYQRTLSGNRFPVQNPHAEVIYRSSRKYEKDIHDGQSIEQATTQYVMHTIPVLSGHLCTLPIVPILDSLHGIVSLLDLESSLRRQKLSRWTLFR